MIVTQYIADNSNLAIAKAATDNGRVAYYPDSGDRLLIDGRDARRGVYLDTTTWMMSDERVAADLWSEACALMGEVDAHNQQVARRQQAEDFERQGAREDAEIDLLISYGEF
jgi:hypothetical protein